jgi:uncharacterized protein
MTAGELLGGVGVGLAGGFTSGLMGVSPGGALVVFATLLLGAEQHVAQGVSLAAQIPPVSLAALRLYRERGSESPLRWLVPLATAFVVGGLVGASGAGAIDGRALRWTYVAYLVGLVALMIARGGRKAHAEESRPVTEPRVPALAAIGLVAGLSSGFLGIGGGLATTVGLTALLGFPQRQAQMVSLALSLIPTTAPAAWLYWRDGWMAPWPVLAGVIAGLVFGTDIGGRLANRLDQRGLRAVLIAFVTAMALYTAYAAIGRI